MRRSRVGYRAGPIVVLAAVVGAGLSLWYHAPTAVIIYAVATATMAIIFRRAS